MSLCMGIWSEKDHKEFDPKNIVRIWSEKDHENLIQERSWKFDLNKGRHIVLVSPKSESKKLRKLDMWQKK